MRVNKEFPKELLKKMLLNVLYEVTEQGFYNSREHDCLNIICQILMEQFHVSQFSESEFIEITNMVNELEADGFIEPLPGSSSTRCKILTEYGKEHVKENLLNFMLPEQEIGSFINRKDLREECLPDYLNGDYEAAILKAFRLIEDMAKNNAIPPSKCIEKEKLSGCFISPDGTLNKSNENYGIDLDSLQRIMLGALVWFKDSSGKKSKYKDSKSAAQVLLFVNLHLNLIDQKKLLYNT